MKTSSKLVSGIGFIILGLALLGGGSYILKDRWVFYNDSILQEGTIIDLETSRSKNSTYYNPVISFQANDGSTYTFTSETGSSAVFDFNKGDKLTVRYIEDNPQMAKIDGLLSLWSLPMALIIAGVIIFLAGISHVHQSRTVSPRNASDPNNAP